MPDMDYHGILPALIATQGEQVLLSTPRGKRGFFHEIWQGGVPGQNSDAAPNEWLRVMVRSDEVGRIREGDLEVFRRTMPSSSSGKSSIHCEWLDTEGGLFSYDDIQAALAAGEDVEALQIGDDEW